MSHSSLTPSQVERLLMLAEEASEVVHACTKALRHGLDSYHPNAPLKVPNSDNLVRELRDLVAVASALGFYGDIDIKDADGFFSPTAQEVWNNKGKWTHHQAYPVEDFK